MLLDDATVMAGLLHLAGVPFCRRAFAAGVHVYNEQARIWATVA